MNNKIPQTKRHLVNKIVENLDSKDILLITGARQTGKTTILRQVEELTRELGDCHFLNLERMDILTSLNEDPLNLLKLINFNEQQNKKCYVFIDEIQYLDNPTNFLKLIYDEYGGLIKLIVSGSSSFYIDKKFKDSLAGRKKIFELGTLGFKEFLEFKQENELVEFLSDGLDIIQQKEVSLVYRKKLEQLFEEFIIYGGYPRVVLTQDLQAKQEILAELANAYVKKDAEESGVENLGNFYKLCRILAGMSGQMLNINKLGNILGVTNVTLKRYMYILSKFFIVSEVRPFSNNRLKEITKMPKVFFQDTGLRNYFVNSFDFLPSRLDKGELLENACFKMFRDKMIPDNIQYWHTQDGHEVDFIINRARAFEVKFIPQLFNFKKYQAFVFKYPKIKLNLITFNNYQDEGDYSIRPGYLI